MEDRSILNGWQRLLRTATDRGAIGVVALVLITALACVVTGAAAPVIYALVAFVVACTVLIAWVSCSSRS